MGLEMAAEDAPSRAEIHLLDMGREEYGDATLCRFGRTTVLIDGGHRHDDHPADGHTPLQEQIGTLLGRSAPPYTVDLLVVTHAHEDHIGCLPSLVANGLLRARWALVIDPALGWGHTNTDGGSDAGPADASPGGRAAWEASGRLAAALAEEPRLAAMDDAALRRFIGDAAEGETLYRSMLATLAGTGTVVRYGNPDDAGLLGPLRDAFRFIGLRVLGPSLEQLRACAEVIRTGSADPSDDTGVPDALLELVQEAGQAGLSEAELYRRLVRPPDASVDASDASGSSRLRSRARNLQSLVVRFRYGGRKYLFPGDMEFTHRHGQGRMAVVGEQVRELRDAIEDDGPYAFVKLSHHGSANGLDRELLRAFGPTDRFGISTGSRSDFHPSTTVLGLLAASPHGVQWARTDVNGRCTFVFSGSQATVAPTRGAVNDRTAPQDTDRAAVPVVAARPGGAQVSVAQAPAGTVEVVTRVPHTSTRVTITIDVAPRADGSGGAVQPGPGAGQGTGAGPTERPSTPETGGAVGPDWPAVGELPALDIAGGRQLPNLLFVTSGPALARAIGEAAAPHAIRALRDRGLAVFDGLPDPRTGILAADAAALVRQQSRRHGDVKGVVILGGYDVVPSQIFDCLPRALRAEGPSDDREDYVVWCDEAYGDLGRDGDSFPDVPVSRIPDGRSRELVFAALQAGTSPRRPARRGGVRNVRRPFADGVYALLDGEEPLLASEPAAAAQVPPAALDADAVYLMLHGEAADGSYFNGERAQDEGQLAAVRVGNVPRRGGAVVFAGCCWGALPVDKPAVVVARTGAVPAPRLAENSIALRWLQAGAIAFVGCTGIHYSPLEAPYNYFGGPLHQAFWNAVGAGRAPAAALFEAKKEYLRALPHNGDVELALEGQAVEHKILHQFTCLGLGW